MKKIKSNALFPKVRQLVLGLLYTQPDHAFYTNEIIRFTNSGNGVVQRELEKLLAMELITARFSGKQKYFQANASSPLYPDLRNIILKTFGLSDVIRDALKAVTKEIHIAFIYGSIASQTDTATSDIDLMIISDTLTYAELFSLLDAPEKNLGRKINPTFYSKAEWIAQHNRKNHFVLQVMKNPKLFLIGTEDELKQLR
jgi:predicted nucleotidyltransferase